MVLLIIQNIFIKGELGREMYVSVNFFYKAKPNKIILKLLISKINTVVLMVMISI